MSERSGLNWLIKKFKIERPNKTQGAGVDGPSLQPSASGLKQGRGVNERPALQTGQSGGERKTDQHPLKDSI